MSIDPRREDEIRNRKLRKRTKWYEDALRDVFAELDEVRGDYRAFSRAMLVPASTDRLDARQALQIILSGTENTMRFLSAIGTGIGYRPAALKELQNVVNSIERLDKAIARIEAKLDHTRRALSK